jgi:alkylation response protein AidB-like acyl-CoA dehydrogenase
VGRYGQTVHGRERDEVTVQAVQVHGALGYVSDYRLERMMRDAKITQV